MMLLIGITWQQKFKLDQIVRVTGDAILCDEVMISKDS